MKLEYMLHAEDLVAFQLFHIRRSEYHRRASRRKRWLWPALFVIIGAGGTFVLGMSMAFFAVYASLALVWILLFPVYIRRYYQSAVKNMIRENLGTEAEGISTLETGEDGIYAESSLGESVTRYKSVQEIARDDGYTYILVGNGMGYILPEKRLSADEVAAFVAEVERRRRAVLPDAHSSHGEE